MGMCAEKRRECAAEAEGSGRLQKNPAELLQVLRQLRSECERDRRSPPLLAGKQAFVGKVLADKTSPL